MGKFANGQDIPTGSVAKIFGETSDGRGSLQPFLAEAISATAYGIFPNSGVVMNAAIQAAITDAASKGYRGLIFPGGVFLIDRAVPIYVPTKFGISGLYGETIFRAQGTFVDLPAFPTLGGAIFNVAQANGARYGTETSRRTEGSGATFNVTVTSGGVSAVTIAAGGTGYKIGAKLLLPSGTILFVTAVSSGAVTGVVIGAAGSGWGTASNPYGHTNTTGQNPGDRVFDLNSFADEVYFKDIVLEGQYGRGNTVLTGTKSYTGINARGILNFSARGIIARGLPDTGIYVFDVKNAVIVDNIADDCGWTAVFGRSRNGFSNVGLYVTDPVQAKALNTEYWVFERNVARNCADVGAQFGLVENFSVRYNTIIGCGAIGIEGESSSFATWSTYAGNGGVRPPGSGVISDNFIDGLMVDGALATDTYSSPNYVSIYGFNGISWTQGNEGTIREGRNYIRNLTGAGLKLVRNSGGRIRGMGGTIIENVQQVDNPAASPVAPGYTGGTTQATGASTNTNQQGVYLSAAEIWWSNNHVQTRYRGVGIAVVPAGGFLSAEVTDNLVDGTTADTTSPSLHFRMARSNTGKYLDFRRNRGENAQAQFLLIETVGTNNNFTASYIVADGCAVRNANRANVAGTPVVHIRSSSGGKLYGLVISVDDLTYIESSLASNVTLPVKIENDATSVGNAANLVSISGMKAPQFATKYDIASMSHVPAATRFANNA